MINKIPAPKSALFRLLNQARMLQCGNSIMGIYQ